MKLLPFSTVFYEDVVNMLYSMVMEANPEKIIGSKQNFYRLVDGWTKDDNMDIVLVCTDTDVIGFYNALVNDNRGLYEANYFVENFYIKPNKRKSRAIYMLFKNIEKYAHSLGLLVSAKFRIDNGFAELIKKHYNVNSKLIQIDERI